MKMKVRWMIAMIVLLALAGCKQIPWQPYTGPDGSFSVQMPGTPEEQKQALYNDLFGNFTAYIYAVDYDSTTYMVVFTQYPESISAISTPFELLDNARDGAVANVQGTLVDEKVIRLGDYPGKEITIRLPAAGMLADVRMYVVDTRLYQVMVTSPEANFSQKAADTFLDSFAIIEK